MSKWREAPTQVVLECEVPESLCDFLEEWSEHTGEDKNYIVQSLFSHGLASVCATNDWKETLVDKVAPILEDFVACAPNDTEVLEIHMETNAVVARGESWRRK